MTDTQKLLLAAIIFLLAALAGWTILTTPDDELIRLLSEERSAYQEVSYVH